MNVQKGDLAVVVRVENAWEEPDLGQLVNVLRPGDDYSDEGDSRHHWEVRAISGRPLHYCDLDGKMGCAGTVDTPDECLRPIRPQSDDAVDTHSLRIPVPHKENA